MGLSKQNCIYFMLILNFAVGSVNKGYKIVRNEKLFSYVIDKSLVFAWLSICLIWYFMMWLGGLTGWTTRCHGW